ncbi:hypothetical protein [Haladaptatus sp. W1]|uniref:hypothetical protein n=1 Tax=Haladaptatus sp. W1 TaxID=1897478 RepID=UPI0015869876|nr:hypothetical protein [Haladaptatus sp. W1]
MLRRSHDVPMCVSSWRGCGFVAVGRQFRRGVVVEFTTMISAGYETTAPLASRD